MFANSLGSLHSGYWASRLDRRYFGSQRERDLLEVHVSRWGRMIVIRCGDFVEEVPIKAPWWWYLIMRTVEGQVMYAKKAVWMKQYAYLKEEGMLDSIVSKLS